MGEVVSLGNLLSAVATRGGDGLPQLKALRERSRAAFVAHGLPTRRMEAWKYSDLTQALNEPARLPGPVHAPVDVPGALLVSLENGALHMPASDFGQISAFSLPQALTGAMPCPAELIGTVNPQQDHPILNLNTALMKDGLVLQVPRGAVGPLHLRFDWLTESQAHLPAGDHLRILIEIEDGAEFTLIESHNGAPSFATIVSEFKLGQGARLNHLRLERLGNAARQSALTLAEIGAAARYRAFYLSEGGHFARHEALLKIAGEEGEAMLDGAYLVGDRCHCDNTTVMTHTAPNTSSRQSFRGVLAGRSRGIFQGCVQVTPEAQRTDAYQMSRALLLSHDAEIATKPELEIFADDVKCSHGATAGELDAMALFFLRSRGIPEAEARTLLIRAFLFESLDSIEDKALRDIAAAVTDEWLLRHAGDVAHVD